MIVYLIYILLLSLITFLPTKWSAYISETGKDNAQEETMDFNRRIDILLEEIHPDNIIDGELTEGTIFSVNRIIADYLQASDSMILPEGDYIVTTINSDTCKLIPTSEANGQTFEVFKHTLKGFFNPEVHKKVVSHANGAIAETNS